MDYGVKYKNIFLKNSEMKGGEIKLKCPENKNILCDKNTDNFGLCVSNKDKCNDNNYSDEDVELEIISYEDDSNSSEYKEEIEKYKEEYNFGKTKGYIDDNLKHSCYNQTTNYSYINKIKKDENIVKNNFSIITLNVMGIYRSNFNVLKLMELRVNILKKYILKNKPDIMCFQEMSTFFFRLLYDKEIKKIYPYYSEKKFTDIILANRNKDIETFTISKYKPNKVIMQSLQGNLGYTNSLQILEFENLIVFNIYLQAGSKASPGQKYKWKNYSRCRKQQLKFIREQIKNYKDIPIILLGDFNFDLNDIDEWPEKKDLDKIELYDSWIECNKNKDIKEGLTENTEINHMRYNSKFEKKLFRYDAILYKNLKSIKSKVICNIPEKLDENFNVRYKEYNKIYENVILPKDKLSDKRIIKTIENDENIYDLFISDHFGVESTFSF